MNVGNERNNNVPNKIEERYDVHITKTEAAEAFPDGIIDKENNEKTIRNYHSLARMLNQYNDRYEHVTRERDILKEVIRFQKEEIHALEKIAMLKNEEAGINAKYKYEEL